MTDGNEVVRTFYEAFKMKDYQTMQSLYRADAVFSDPVFGRLDAKEVQSMWEMLCLQGKDLVLTYDNVSNVGEVILADWKAEYTFSLTGRKVENVIHAEFVIKDGKILTHHDQFDLYRWSRQAFGFMGILFGWTGVFQKKLSKQARQNLQRFISGRKNQKGDHHGYQ